MNVTVVGAQMGDEGKGGMVDLLSHNADIVVRYQGGDNAGHTVVHDGSEYAFSLVPSGAVRGRTGILGNGCVVNPSVLFAEIDDLRDRGLTPDVRVAERAHVVMPYHSKLDRAEEAAKSETDLEAGTTGRGIGPTYEDKAARRGIRVCDLLDPDVLRERLEYVIPLKRTVAEEYFDLEPGAAFDVEPVFEEYVEYGRRLEKEGMVVDAGGYIAEQSAEGAEILFEGAQGSLIDIDHGIYPYVTSSNTTAPGVLTGTGTPPSLVGDGEIVGATKAYVSRVGTGPLPTEIEGDIAETIREKGGEYGTVTGRPRRIGWLDMPMLRHTARVSGFTGLSIHHIDALSGIERVKVAHSYQKDGETVTTVPAATSEWARCKPEYETFPGWPDLDWKSVAEEGYDALPENARAYVQYISNELDTPIYGISVGPTREHKFLLENPFE